jgi:xanthine dehydrogenase accessory factor
MNEIEAILGELEREPGSPHALATLVAIEGSSYRRAGARLLVDARGRRLGSISGGCLEEDVQERARQVLATGMPQVALYDTTEENDLVWGTGLGCEGAVRIFIERLPGLPDWAGTLRRNLTARRETQLGVVWQDAEAGLLGTHEAGAVAGRVPAKAAVFHDKIIPPPRLLVFGAGDDARPLVEMAKTLGWQVAVSDARPAYATRERFPSADEVTAAQPKTAATVAMDAWTAAMVMSHRYVYDAAVLRALLPRELPYLGMLGPRKRTEKMLAELEAGGLVVTEAMRARLHAPVGLNLGGDTAGAVALAALAEMQASFAGRDARPLRERTRPIHD